MSLSYPKLPAVESESEGEKGSASGQRGKLQVKSKSSYESEKEDGTGSDDEVDELSKLLANFGKDGKKVPENESGKPETASSPKSSGNGNSGPANGKDKHSGREQLNDRIKSLFARPAQHDTSEETSGQNPSQEKEPSDKGKSPKEEESNQEGDGPSGHKKATSYTMEQRETATRVQKCSDKDYYGILGLEEACSERDIKKAYRILSLLTHPDKNKFKDAPEAFRLISKAYQVLGNSAERTKYDKDRKKYKLRGVLDPVAMWDEKFADNASGTDSGSSSSEESDEEEEAKPDAFRLGIYKEATPLVGKLLADPHNRSTRSKLESLNKQIRKQNKKDSIKEGEFLISLNVLRAIGIEAEAAAKSLANDPDNNKAKELLTKLKKQLEKTIRINSYPTEWLNFMVESQKDKGKERDKPSSSKEKGSGNGQEKPSPRKTNRRGRKDDSSSGGKDEEGDIQMTDVDSSRRKWKPGQTRNGENILGWRPFYKTDRKTDEVIFSGCQFVIEKKDQANPIALVSGQDVGRRVTDAYRNLPEEQQNDIRFSEKKYTYKNADEFVEILGFASKPFNTRTEDSGAYYPDGYALYSFNDDSERLVSRSALRKVLGKADADNEIAEFYDDVGETPPWLAKPKKLLTNGTEVTRRRKSRKHESTDDSASDSESMFVSHRKRQMKGDEDSENESSSDVGRRKPRRSSKSKRKMVESNGQMEVFAGVLEKFMNQMADENRRQAEDVSRRFEEALRQRPKPATA